MDRNRRFDDRQCYEQRFLRFSDSVEKWLFRCAAVLFFLLVIFQALLSVGGVRERLTVVDRLEGERVYE